MKYKSFEDFKKDETMLMKMYEAVTKFCGDVSEMTMQDEDKKMEPGDDKEKDMYKPSDSASKANPFASIDI